MKRLRRVLTMSALALVSLPAFAQDPGPGSNWHGPHPGMFFAPFAMLLALIGFVTVIMVLVRLFSRGGHRP